MTDARRRIAVSGHTGEVDTAREGLKDTESRVRELALGALARLGSLAPPDLVAAAGDPAPGVRRRVAELAPTLSWAVTDQADAAAALLDLLGDEDAGVVEAAAWSLGECRPPAPGAVDLLATVAHSHADALCREAAVAALGALGDPQGLPTILAALADKATVRRRAVIALAPFDGPEIDEALERAREDRDWQVRQAAEDLLGRTGG